MHRMGCPCDAYNWTARCNAPSNVLYEPRPTHSPPRKAITTYVAILSQLDRGCYRDKATPDTVPEGPRQYCRGEEVPSTVTVLSLVLGMLLCFCVIVAATNSWNCSAHLILKHMSFGRFPGAAKKTENFTVGHAAHGHGVWRTHDTSKLPDQCRWAALQL